MVTSVVFTLESAEESSKGSLPKVFGRHDIAGVGITGGQQCIYIEQSSVDRAFADVIYGTEQDHKRKPVSASLEPSCGMTGPSAVTSTWSPWAR